MIIIPNTMYLNKTLKDNNIEKNKESEFQTDNKATDEKKEMNDSINKDINSNTWLHTWNETEKIIFFKKLSSSGDGKYINFNALMILTK